MDARGRPVGASEECRRPEAAVQVIQHKDWLQAVAQESKRDFLKAVFRTAVHEFQGMFAVFEQPIVIVRKESNVYVKATRNVPEKQIVIPLFFRKLTSVYHYEEVAAHVPLTAVDAELTWALTEKERSVGMEEDEHEAPMKVVPEFKAPPSVEGKPPVAARNDNIHPFWAITRLEKKDDECNCIL